MSLLSKSHTEYLLLFYDKGGQNVIMDLSVSILIWESHIEDSYYKARHAHKRLYTVLPKYSKIQVLPGITSCRLVKDNKQAIELNSLLINNMPEGGYG